MFALVKNNQVVRTVREESIEWNGFTYSNVYLLTPQERKNAGIYDFVTEPSNPPDGKKAQGTTVTVGDGVVTESPIYVDKTPEELDNEVKAKRAAMVCSPRQIRQALTAAGLRAAVEAGIAAGDQDIKDWYEFATAFERLHPSVVALAAALNVSEQQLDDLFALACSL